MVWHALRGMPYQNRAAPIKRAAHIVAYSMLYATIWAGQAKFGPLIDGPGFARLYPRGAAPPDLRARSAAPALVPRSAQGRPTPDKHHGTEKGPGRGPRQGRGAAPPTKRGEKLGGGTTTLPQGVLCALCQMGEYSPFIYGRTKKQAPALTAGRACGILEISWLPPAELHEVASRIIPSR